MLLYRNSLPQTIRSTVKKRTIVSLIWMGIFIITTLALLIQQGFMESSAMTDFFNKTSETSDAPRVSQANALIQGWYEHPLLGAGTGIDASVSRSAIPGNYELTYLAKLFETGILGMTVYLGLWGIVFLWIFQMFKSHIINPTYTISLFNAMIIFMISNATNPYLNAFDYLWYMYVPLIFINLDVKEKLKYLNRNT